jgi:hypothetical protein
VEPEATYNRYPEREQLPVAVAEVMAAHEAVTPVGVIAELGIDGALGIAGTEGVRIVSTGEDHGPVPTSFSA